MNLEGFHEENWYNTQEDFANIRFALKKTPITRFFINSIVSYCLREKRRRTRLQLRQCWSMVRAMIISRGISVLNYKFTMHEQNTYFVKKLFKKYC